MSRNVRRMTTWLFEERGDSGRQMGDRIIVKLLEACICRANSEYYTSVKCVCVCGGED